MLCSKIFPRAPGDAGTAAGFGSRVDCPATIIQPSPLESCPKNMTDLISSFPLEYKTWGRQAAETRCDAFYALWYIDAATQDAAVYHIRRAAASQSGARQKEAEPRFDPSVAVQWDQQKQRWIAAYPAHLTFPAAGLPAAVAAIAPNSMHRDIQSGDHLQNPIEPAFRKGRPACPAVTPHHAKLRRGPS